MNSTINFHQICKNNLAVMTQHTVCNQIVIIYTRTQLLSGKKHVERKKENSMYFSHARPGTVVE